MLLQLPTESKWHAPGSAYHIALLQGLSHGLDVKKEVSTLLKLLDLVDCHHPQLVPPGLLHFTGLKEFL